MKVESHRKYILFGLDIIPDSCSLRLREPMCPSVVLCAHILRRSLIVEPELVIVVSVQVDTDILVLSACYVILF